MISLLLSAVLASTPADEVRAAAADAEALPAEVRAGTRYLTLYTIEPAGRPKALQTVGYVLNALSRTRAITQPVLVSPTLVRFTIGQYAPHPEEFAAWFQAWEKLAQLDPYFHLRTEVEIKSEVGRRKAEAAGAHNSTFRMEFTRRGGNSAFKTVTTDGGWSDLTAAARLRAATHSAGALLRADYFVAQATIPPRYYEFAGVPGSENEFLKSLGVDQKVIDRLRANAGANLIASGVTAKPRRVVWLQGPLGGVYSTLDVERVDAARDPLRRPISAAGLEFKYDVSEWFAVAPNGLWRTALFDAAGRRQDSVPDKVAKDTSDPAGDGIVVPLVSCIRCHREAGLRPFSDDQTRLLSGRVDLYSYDPNLVQRAAEFYDEPRLQRQMQFDRQTYANAVARATTMQGASAGSSNGEYGIQVQAVEGLETNSGLRARSNVDSTSFGPSTAGQASSGTHKLSLSPEEVVDALAAVVRQHAYLPVDLEQAALEVGLTSAQFRSALSPTRDPVILLLLEGRSVLRGQWESSFAEAALAAAAILPHPLGEDRGEVAERSTPGALTLPSPKGKGN